MDFAAARAVAVASQHGPPVSRARQRGVGGLSFKKGSDVVVVEEEVIVAATAHPPFSPSPEGALRPLPRLVFCRRPTGAWVVGGEVGGRWW